MTNRYKNRRNAVVNPPFWGKHCKTAEQRERRHKRNEIMSLLRVFKHGKTHADMKGCVVNAN